MGVMTKLAEFFNEKAALGQEINTSAYLAQREKDERREHELASRLLAWYLRDRDALTGKGPDNSELVPGTTSSTDQGYLPRQAAITFGSETERWQWPLINGVQRVIRRIAMQYASPPERKYYRVQNNGQRAYLQPGDEQLERIRNMYRFVDRDKHFKELDRYSTLLNTAHLEIGWREDAGGAVTWQRRLRPSVTVIPDPMDILELYKFAHHVEIESTETEGAPIEGWWYWTEDEHYFLRSDGHQYSLTEDLENPFIGVELEHSTRNIPIVTVRKLESDDYWGRYGADIVDAFEQAMIMLGNLWQTTFFQAHGYAIGINLGLSEKEKGGGDILTTAEGLFAAIDNVDKDMVPPDLRFATPEPKIEAVLALLDWFIRNSGGSYGMNPAAWSMESKAESGFAKVVENLEIFEQRDEEITDWIKTELQADEWSRVTHNMNTPEAQHIDPDIRLELVPTEVEFPMAPAEEAAFWTTAIADGRESVVDYLMKKHKLSSREEALEMAKMIAKENNELKKLGLTPSVMFGNDPNNPDDPANNPQE